MALKDKYVTISEAARELWVTRQTISRWIRKGKIVAEKIGRETLIKKKDLYQYRRLRLVEMAADSIIALYKAEAEDYCREKGYPSGRIEIVTPDEGQADNAIAFSAEEKAEVLSRFQPILEGFLKDFEQNLVMRGNPSENKTRGKKTK